MTAFLILYALLLLTAGFVGANQAELGAVTRHQPEHAPAVRARQVFLVVALVLQAVHMVVRFSW